MFHGNHFPKLFVLTVLQALYDYFYHHLKLEREIDEYMEGVFKRNANYRAQIAEDRKVIQTERELRESSERK